MRAQWFTLFSLFSAFILQPIAHATPVEFVASLDRNQIGEEESVQLKFEVRVDGDSQVGEVSYEAPDFTTVNEFSSNFVQSYYENGHFGVKNTQQLTKVLRPKRAGTFQIKNIQVEVAGRVFKASDLVVSVGAASAGTAPPKGYGGAGVGLRGSGKASNKAAFFTRAELSKDKAYKGEQVIVSYYVYRRVRVFNIQVDKFPVLGGFLREDIDIPVMTGRLDTERVVLDGVAYERSLLARYAAYPLKEGKLEIDQIGLKLNYQGAINGADPIDDDDPFAQFFRSMSPQAGTSKSPIETLQVLPLPSEGMPPSFTGGVGDFQVTAQIDKNEVHMNEAVTLNIKIEGQGNTASVEIPKIQWPENLELFESKGHSTASKGGVGSKTFEMILIPRKEGEFIIPPIDLGFFDPVKKSYAVKTTPKLTFKALPALASSISATNPTASGLKKSDQNGESELSIFQIFLKNIRKVLGIALAVILILGMIFTVLKGYKPAAQVVAAEPPKPSEMLEKKPAHSAISKSWNRLHEVSRAIDSGASWSSVTEGYELLCGAVYDLIDKNYQITSRAIARSEMGEILVREKKMNPALWKQIDQLLEYSEAVRFASAAGAVSEVSARSEFLRFIKEAQNIEQSLNRSEPRV